MSETSKSEQVRTEKKLLREQLAHELRVASLDETTSEVLLQKLAECQKLLSSLDSQSAETVSQLRKKIGTLRYFADKALIKENLPAQSDILNRLSAGDVAHLARLIREPGAIRQETQLHLSLSAGRLGIDVSQLQSVTDTLNEGLGHEATYQGRSLEQAKKLLEKTMSGLSIDKVADKAFVTEKGSRRILADRFRDAASSLVANLSLENIPQFQEFCQALRDQLSPKDRSIPTMAQRHYLDALIGSCKYQQKRLEVAQITFLVSQAIEQGHVSSSISSQAKQGSELEGVALGASDSHEDMHADAQQSNPVDPVKVLQKIEEEVDKKQVAPGFWNALRKSWFVRTAVTGVTMASLALGLFSANDTPAQAHIEIVPAQPVASVEDWPEEEFIGEPLNHDDSKTISYDQAAGENAVLLAQPIESSKIQSQLNRPVISLRPSDDRISDEEEAAYLYKKNVERAAEFYGYAQQEIPTYSTFKIDQEVAGSNWGFCGYAAVSVVQMLTGQTSPDTVGPPQSYNFRNTQNLRNAQQIFDNWVEYTKTQQSSSGDRSLYEQTLEKGTGLSQIQQALEAKGFQVQNSWSIHNNPSVFNQSTQMIVVDEFVDFESFILTPENFIEANGGFFPAIVSVSNDVLFGNKEVSDQFHPLDLYTGETDRYSTWDKDASLVPNDGKISRVEVKYDHWITVVGYATYDTFSLAPYNELQEGRDLVFTSHDRMFTHVIFVDSVDRTIDPEILRSKDIVMISKNVYLMPLEKFSTYVGDILTIQKYTDPVTGELVPMNNIFYSADDLMTKYPKLLGAVEAW